MTDKIVDNRANPAELDAAARLRKELIKEDGDLPRIFHEMTNEFCVALRAVFERSSVANVQTCRKWIIKHIIRSKARVTALGEYLVTISKSQVHDQNKDPEKHIQNRFGIVQIVSDVLHDFKYHSEIPNSLVEHWFPYIRALVDLVACCLHDKGSVFEQKLKGIVKFWRANQLLPANQINGFIGKINETLRMTQGEFSAEPQRGVVRLPEIFGDKRDPWHDLPTSYIMDTLISRPGNPIRSSDLKTTRFTKEPSQKTIGLLDEYFEALAVLHAPMKSLPTGDQGGYKLFYDALGQVSKSKDGVKVDKILSNGYGWSMETCNSMNEHGFPGTILREREIAKNERERRERHEEQSERRGYDSDDSHSSTYRRRSRSVSSASVKSYSSRNSRSRSPSRNNHRQQRDRRESPRRGSHRFDRRDSDRDFDQRQDLRNSESQVNIRPGPPPVPQHRSNPNLNWKGYQPQAPNFDGASDFANRLNNEYGQPIAPNLSPPNAPQLPSIPVQFPGPPLPNIPFQQSFQGPPHGLPPPPHSSQLPPPPPNFGGHYQGQYPPPPPPPPPPPHGPQFANPDYGNFGGNQGYHDDRYGQGNQGFQGHGHGHGFNGGGGGYGRGRGPARGSGGNPRWS